MPETPTAAAAGTVRIGDLTVNRIGLGTNRITDTAAAETVLRRAVELSINFIDTADAYTRSQSETTIGRVLSPYPEGLVIATKGGSIRPGGAWERDGRPEHLRRACEASLKALGTDRIDLYQLHAPDPRVPVEESVGTLADLQREGKIRHIGVSNFDLDQLERGMREAEIVSLQNKFSVINQREELALLRFCEERKITYIPWNPVGGRGVAPQLAEQSRALEEIATSHAAAPHAVAIAWLLQLSPAMLPIPGTRSFDHLAEDLKGAEITLSPEEMARLSGE